MSDLVTGEAVVLGLQPARLPSRTVAMVIDLVVYWGTYLILGLVMVSATASLDDAAAAAVTVGLLLLLLIGLPVGVETLSRGKSLGKLALGLRVVRDDGGPIRFRHALVRGAVGAVEIQLSMGVIASVASLVSARGRRVGDVFAGTLVVRERVPARYAEQPAPPPWMEGQLSGLDLSRLPDGLWLALRQYLSRMDELDPQVGWNMAVRLASDVSARTGTAIPEGVQPAEYLAAVVAERQSRDAQRVWGDGYGGWPYEEDAAASGYAQDIAGQDQGGTSDDAYPETAPPVAAPAAAPPVDGPAFRAPAAQAPPRDAAAPALGDGAKARTGNAEITPGRPTGFAPPA
jgi:uncharacterized RDD family membrane protein YckC